MLGWYGGLGGADQGSWKGIETGTPWVTHAQTHNNQGRGGVVVQCSQGQGDLPACVLFQAWCHESVLREQRSGCIPAASGGQGQDGLGIRFNSSQWAVLAQRGAWGRGAEQSRVR